MVVRARTFVIDNMRSIVVELGHRTSLVELSYGNLRKHVL